MSLNDTPQEVTALLRDALNRGRRVLEQKSSDEAELREALCWLKLASDNAEPVYIIEGTALNHPLIDETTQLVEKLMGAVKRLNPALTTWEKARDPRYAVVIRTTRRGSQPPRGFDPSEMRREYDANRARIYHNFQVPVQPAAPEPSGQGCRSWAIPGGKRCSAPCYHCRNLWKPNNRSGDEGAKAQGVKQKKGEEERCLGELALGLEISSWRVRRPN